MGDRGNIVVRQGAVDSNEEDVWLYSHWIGSDLPILLQAALAKKWRWTDATYLTRIIFDTMTEGSHDEETGFGIGTTISDNEHDILVVLAEEQKVVVCSKGAVKDGRLPNNIVKGLAYTFEQYINIKTLPEV